MRMFTVYTMLKPFKGYIGTIQRNALRSWTLLRPRPEIIMFGVEEGVAEAAREVGAIHIPHVKRNAYGTALVNDIFARAEREASNDLLCFINADIIVMSDFTEAVGRVKDKKRCMMCGTRWNLDLKEPVDFSDGWEARMRSLVLAKGVLSRPDAIDFFTFPKGFWPEFPPFSIGRPRYDNWMIYTARHRGDLVINATPAVMAVHQNHDYRHVPGGINNTIEGPEAEANKDLYGRGRQFYSLLDANMVMTKDGLKRNINPTLVKHAIYRWFGR